MHRKSYLLILAIAGLLGVVLAARSCGPTTPGFVLETAEELPEDAVLVLAVESVSALVGSAEEPGAYPGLREAIEEEYGWGADELERMADLGLDADAHAWLALLEAPRPVFAMSLGFSGDLEDLRRGLVEIGDMSEEVIVERSFGSIDGFVIEGKYAVFLRDERLVSVSVYEAWFDSTAADDLEAVATSVAERDWDENASRADGFDALTQLDRPVEALLLVNLAAAMRQLSAHAELGLFVPRIDLVGFSAGLGRAEGERYLLHRVLFGENSQLANRLLGAPLSADPLERIPGRVLGGAHFSVNPGGLLDVLEVVPFGGGDSHGLLREVRWFAQDILSLDLEEDLDDLLTGEVGLFLRELAPAGERGTEAAMFIGVADEDEVQRLIDAAIEHLRANASMNVVVNDALTRLELGNSDAGAVLVEDGYLWLLVGDETIRSVSSGDGTPFVAEDSRAAEVFANEWVAASYVDAASLQTIETDTGAGVFDWYFEYGGEPLDTITYVMERDDELFRGSLTAELSEGASPAPGRPVSATFEAEAGRAEPGRSRENPLSPTTVVEIDGWELQVVDWARLDRFPAEHSQSSRELDDESVVRVDLVVTCTSGFRRTYTISGDQLSVTGDRGQAYATVDSWALDGRVQRNGTTYEGERRIETSLYFVVPSDERNLMLAAQSSSSLSFDGSGRSCRFVALDEGASLSTEQPAPEPISAAAGTWDDSVPLGERAVAEDWIVEVTEVFRGEVAQRLRQEDGHYRANVGDGLDKLQIHLSVERLGDSSCAEEIGQFDFDVIDAARERHHIDTYWALEPSLTADLFSGARARGWLSADVPVDGELRLVFRHSDPPVHFDLVPANLTDPFSAPGYTIENPAPFGAEIDVGGWRLRVDEVVRGDEALARLESHADSPFGIDRPEVGEYFLVQVYVEPLSASARPLRRSDLRLVDVSGATVSPTYWPRYLPALDRVESDAEPAALWLVYEVASGLRWRLELDRPQQRFWALE